VAGSGAATADFINYFGNGTHEIGLNGSNVMTGDPLFLDASRHDYRLVIGSAALDNGTNANVTVDIMGLPRPTGTGFERGAHGGAIRPRPLA
jgi:hypothetical protein